MGIDKTSTPRFSICIEDKEKLLNEARTKAEENCLRGEDSEIDYIQLDDDNFVTEGEEFYYDESTGEFTVSGTGESAFGKMTYFFTMPLTDTVLIDILGHSVKKINKLKSVIESLK